MPKSFLHKAVDSVFHLTATNHWAAVKMLMETQIGSILTDTPAEGGSAKAFFEPHVLVGEHNCLSHAVVRTLASSKTTFELNLEEPVGLGKTTSEAVLDLWDKITTLPADYYILKVIQHLNPEVPEHAAMIEKLDKNDYGLVSDPQYAEYQLLQFSFGQFVNCGQVFKEAPPARLTHPQSANPTIQTRFIAGAAPV